MKLSVLTVPLQGMPAREAFTYLSKLGVDQVGSVPAAIPMTTTLNHRFI